MLQAASVNIPPTGSTTSGVPTGSASVTITSAESTASEVPTGVSIETGIKILKYFETKYQCSGICTPSLFYYHLELNEGIPSTTCLSYVKEEVGDSLSYLGITALVTGVMMFLIWMC
jgi:hypothetical protein